MKLLFLDTETTGLDPVKNGIIQISGIIEIDGVVKEEFDFRCNIFPGKVCNGDALECNGKTLEQIKTFEDPRVVYRKLVGILTKYIDRYDKNDRFYLVGQNVKFDYDMMRQWFEDNGDRYFYTFIFYHLIDIITISALFHITGIMKLPNMKLVTVAEHFGIKFNAHDSKEDIRVCREIFYKFVAIVKEKKCQPSMIS